MVVPWRDKNKMYEAGPQWKWRLASDHSGIKDDVRSRGYRPEARSSTNCYTLVWQKVLYVTCAVASRNRDVVV
jgi:hypothetical protein